MVAHLGASAHLPARWQDLPRCAFWNKVCHPDRESAVAHAEHLNKAHRARGQIVKVTVFRCDLCDKLHVGDRGKRRKRH